jgi:hypothetical protein
VTGGVSVRRSARNLRTFDDFFDGSSFAEADDQRRHPALAWSEVAGNAPADFGPLAGGA